MKGNKPKVKFRPRWNAICALLGARDPEERRAISPFLLAAAEIGIAPPNFQLSFGAPSVYGPFHEIVPHGQDPDLLPDEQVPWSLLRLGVALREGNPHDFAACGILDDWGISHVAFAMTPEWATRFEERPTIHFAPGLYEAVLFKAVGDPIDWLNEKYVLATSGDSQSGRRTLLYAEHVARDL